MSTSSTKSKAELKAERRAQQEAQRAAKAAGDSKPPKKYSERPKNVEPLAPKKAEQQTVTNGEKKEELHSAFAALLLTPFAHCTNDVDDDCKALAIAIADYARTNKVWHRMMGAGDAAQLEHSLIRQLHRLMVREATSVSSDQVYARLPSSCATLVRQLLLHLHKHAHSDMPELCTVVATFVEDFVRERVQLASDAIVTLYAKESIDHCIDRGGQVLTYGWSALMERIFIECLPSSSPSAINQTCHVCVLDSSPHYNGKRLVRALRAVDIPCSYALLNSIRHVMRNCRLVLLPSRSVLANGDVTALMGSAAIALCARAANIAVLVVAPTHTFNDSMSGGDKEECEVVSADMVTGIVTELRLLPASSAPAVLRVKQQTI